MESIWTQTTEIQSYDKLTEDMTADAVVIGGGMAGILTAYKLTQTILIQSEASRIGSGQTKNTTAKITSQHDIIYSRLTEDFGEDLARQYAAANENAIREYKRIIEKENIDRNFEEKPAYLYSQNQQDVKRLRMRRMRQGNWVLTPNTRPKPICPSRLRERLSLIIRRSSTP